MRTRFEIVPRQEVIEQIDRAIQKPFRCTKCKGKVRVTDGGAFTAEKFLLVPQLRVGRSPKGEIAIDVFCESCGLGLINAIQAFMITAETSASIVLKCGTK